jgi:uncharacterized protein
VKRSALIEALVVAAVVTGAVTLAAAVSPDKYVATAVGFVFLAATWYFVWRKEDSRVVAYGLTLGGLVLPGRLDHRRLVVSALRALAWASGAALLTFGPFYFGWRSIWMPRGPFALHLQPLDALNEVFGQIVIIALPEEAFYRGYLQSRLDEALPWPRVRLFGAEVGPALVITSIIFALGHVATIREPSRLAVFFPSLLFGWLRLRTRSVGAGIAFHAMCNLFSEALGRGFRVY